MSLREPHSSFEDPVSQDQAGYCDVCLESRRSRKATRSRRHEMAAESKLLDSQKALLLEALAYQRDSTQPDMEGPVWQLLPHF